MAKTTIRLKSQGNGSIKLSPAPLIPGMSFDISNQTGVDIKVVIDGKNIRLELEQG